MRKAHKHVMACKVVSGKILNTLARSVNPHSKLRVGVGLGQRIAQNEQKIKQFLLG